MIVAKVAPGLGKSQTNPCAMCEATDAKAQLRPPTCNASGLAFVTATMKEFPDNAASATKRFEWWMGQQQNLRCPPRGTGTEKLRRVRLPTTAFLT